MKTILLVIVALSFFGCSSNEDIQRLKSQNASLNKSFDKLKSDNLELREEITQLKEQINILQTDHN